MNLWSINSYLKSALLVTSNTNCKRDSLPLRVVLLRRVVQEWSSVSGDLWECRAIISFSTTSIKGMKLSTRNTNKWLRQLEMYLLESLYSFSRQWMNFCSQLTRIINLFLSTLRRMKIVRIALALIAKWLRSRSEKRRVKNEALMLSNQMVD